MKQPGETAAKRWGRPRTGIYFPRRFAYNIRDVVRERLAADDAYVLGASPCAVLVGATKRRRYVG